ncbi:hypothetical protein MN608_04567 [Microdochium nivale]|nr:hypothetical protein MN608_04567 [Microdochium nivale]
MTTTTRSLLERTRRYGLRHEKPLQSHGISHWLPLGTLVFSETDSHVARGKLSATSSPDCCHDFSESRDSTILVPPSPPVQAHTCLSGWDASGPTNELRCRR